jgi:hypothetical protein
MVSFLRELSVPDKQTKQEYFPGFDQLYFPQCVEFKHIGCNHRPVGYHTSKEYPVLADNELLVEDINITF